MQEMRGDGADVHQQPGCFKASEKLSSKNPILSIKALDSKPQRPRPNSAHTATFEVLWFIPSSWGFGLRKPRPTNAMYTSTHTHTRAHARVRFSITILYVHICIQGHMHTYINTYCMHACMHTKATYIHTYD